MKKSINFLILTLFIQSTFSFDQGQEGHDIILVIGQSNAVGRGHTESIVPIKNVETENEKLVNRFLNPSKPKLYQFTRYTGKKIIPITKENYYSYENNRGLCVLQNHTGQKPGFNDGNFPNKCPTVGINSKDKRKGFAVQFALRYAYSIREHTKRKVLIVPAAQGSTSILEWQKNFKPQTMRNIVGENKYFKKLDSNDTNLFSSATNTVKKLLQNTSQKNRVVAILFQQGEADLFAMGNEEHKVRKFIRKYSNPNWTMTKSRYQTELKRLIRDIRSELRPYNHNHKYPFLAGTLADNIINYSSNIQQTHINDLKQAQINALASQSNCDKVVTTRFLNTNMELHPNKSTGQPDYVHFSARSLIALGNRYYKKFIDNKDNCNLR